jgi:hypothetical protein
VFTDELELPESLDVNPLAIILEALRVKSEVLDVDCRFEQASKDSHPAVTETVDSQYDDLDE